MKIRYNIANKRKIDYFKFILISAVLVVLSVMFIVVSLNQLAAAARQFQEEKDELRAYQEKIEGINERNEQLKQEIQKIKKKWGKKRRFLNALIDDRLFSYIPKLDKLEKLLPAGVFISSITLSTKGNDNVELGIGAVSAQKLLEAYKTFLKYNMVISNETESSGLFKATIRIRLKNENK